MDLLLRLIEEMRIGTEDVQKKVTNTPAFGHFKPSMRNNIISRLERDQEVIRKMVPDINRWKCSVNWSKKRMLNMGDSTSTQQSDSTRI